jgi:hypothetical protein
MAATEPLTSARRLAAVDRQVEALKLRRAGKSFADIAQRLGYASRSNAYTAVMHALRRTLQEPADEVRRLEIERLDGLLSGLWERAAAGHLPSVDRVLAIMDRRAKLLGLDAPTRVDITARLRERAIAEGLDPDEVVAAAQRIIRGA